MSKKIENQFKITNFFKADHIVEKCDISNNVNSNDIIDKTPDKKRKRPVVSSRLSLQRKEQNCSQGKRKCLKEDADIINFVCSIPEDCRIKSEPRSVLKDKNVNVELIPVPVVDNTSSPNQLISKDMKNVYTNGSNCSLSSNKCLENDIYLGPKLENKTDIDGVRYSQVSDHNEALILEETLCSSKSNKINNFQEKSNEHHFSSLPSQTLFDETSMDDVDLASAIQNAEKTYAAQFLDDVDFSLLDDCGSSGNSLQAKQLRLDKYQQCEVLEVQSAGGEKYITLRSFEGVDTARCCLKDCWVQIPLSVRDIVAVHNAYWSIESSIWILDMEHGFLVHYPDMLLSATTVTGSLFCRRKSVLSNWFRGMEPTARVMVLGSLAHELLQEVLRQKVSHPTGIHKIKTDLLTSPNSLKMMYACGMSESEAVAELSMYVPNIALLAARCTKGSYIPGSWDENILEVADIEEEIWVPSMGLKGKIDVTYRTKSKLEVIPMELKTGASSFSAEHSGQVILYLLMMNNLGLNVKRGILIYLKNMAMKEISTSHSSSRDLIVLRNEVAHSLKLANETANISKVPLLPDTINNKRACERCPLKGLCSAYLRAEGVTSHPLIENGAAKHLEPQHLSYLVHWGALLALEECERLKNSYLSDMWKLSSSEREAKGHCLSSLSLKYPVMAANGSFQHVFYRKSLKKKVFSKGEYVLVSSEHRLSVASGTIYSISEDQITLCLNRDLSKMEAMRSFDIDKYEVNSAMSYNMSGLGLLMDETAEAKKLRHIIIDKKKPKVAVLHPDLTDLNDILSQLNPSQQAVVKHIFQEKDFLLVQGMPGTGKTTTIATVIRLLVKRGHSVLITSNTHTAVDNVLLRLIGQVDFLRIGSNNKINPKLWKYSEAELLASCKSVEELEITLNTKNVIGATCLGTSSPVLARRHFSVCIVDESTQVLQTSILRPLLMCDRFVLIGDPEQLPPVVRSETASHLGLSESLFVHLQDVGRVISLDLQYRMNKTIEDLANALTYGGRLKCGSSKVASSTLNISIPPEIPNWQKRLLEPNLSQSVIFVDTGNTCIPAQGQEREGGCVNTREAALVVCLVEAFEKIGITGNMIGVIAPFQIQVALLQNLCTSVKTSTIDQFQGIDREVIIFSCTRSKKQQALTENINEQDAGNDLKTLDTEILNDKRRLTVAITRSKHKLIILGDMITMKMYVPFKLLIKHLQNHQIYKLIDGCDDFKWNEVVQRVT